MEKTLIDDLQEGQILGQDVFDAQGRVLLGKGTVLSDRHKKIFKRFEIESLMIMDPDNPDDSKDTDSPATKPKEESVAAGDNSVDQKRVENMEQIFSKTKDQPLMDELYKLAIKYAGQGVGDV